MNIEQMLAVLNPEIVERLRTAVEIGKWPNGVALTKEQREISMQAVYAWEMKHLPEDERSGYIDRGTKEEGEECDDDHHHQHDDFQPIKFI
ncbi:MULTISPECIES: YeaC family protein [unclassified Acinetobacter]|uniref:YeaC family protein n=1 Tax=unclassified Acinetobacter TaxID=196816 RepID=UPI000DA69EA2|nr:DUF1315 family protein [Acinetobacter sp. WCHAc060042]